MKYKHKVSFVCMVLLAVCCVKMHAAKISATGKNFKYAGYRKNGNPHFILYGNQGTLDGQKVKINNVLIDLFKEKCTNLDQVLNKGKLGVYRIDDSYESILKFWDRRAMTEFFINSNQAVFDQATGIIKGDENIKVRSKAFDINGIGFDADYKNKTIHIRKDVQVVIRSGLFEGRNTTSLLESGATEINENK